MDPVVEEWFARRTWQEPGWSVDELVAAKAGRRVAVVLPALDEETTVGRSSRPSCRSPSAGSRWWTNWL